MKSIYITGMSGTGKSSVIKSLQNKGIKAIDTDYGDWKEVSISDGVPEWILKEEQLKQLLLRPLTSPIFISGCCSNQAHLYSLFDHIVLLSASLETILERVANRISNPYGKTLQERNEIIWNFENIQPFLKENATIELDTEAMTIEEIATSLELLVRN